MPRKFLNGIQDYLLGGVETYEAALGANVSLSSSNTWTDVLSQSLTAGTWVIMAQVTHSRSATTAETVYARLSDGTNHYASSQMYHASSSGAGVVLFLVAKVTLSATTTIKVQAATSAGAAASTVIAALTANGVGNNATKLVAMRVNAGTGAVKGIVQLTAAQYAALGTPDPQTLYAIVG